MNSTALSRWMTLSVELAATLREHLRIPGIGETQVRFFRDKLAMRMGAHAAGILVPEFVGAFNYDRVRTFLESSSRTMGL